MKLSIVTINYNNCEGLRRTIKTVLNQTWRDFEWIIIDGGSTDGSKELIENISTSTNAKISYWCSEPDKGIYNAMNKGIAQANGEYVNFMNSGDEFASDDVLEKVFSEVHTSDIIYGDSNMQKETGTERFKFPYPIDIYYFFTDPICHQAMFTKTKWLKEKAFDESYKIAADIARTLEMTMRGCTFEYVPIIICNYEMTGVSSSNKSLCEKEHVRAFEEIVPDYMNRTILRLYQYEKGHLYTRLRKVIADGGVKAILLKIYLKFFG